MNCFYTITHARCSRGREHIKAAVRLTTAALTIERTSCPMALDDVIHTRTNSGTTCRHTPYHTQVGRVRASAQWLRLFRSCAAAIRHQQCTAIYGCDPVIVIEGVALLQVCKTFSHAMEPLRCCRLAKRFYTLWSSSMRAFLLADSTSYSSTSFMARTERNLLACRVQTDITHNIKSTRRQSTN